MQDQQTLKIDVISDVMCPWCYIGKRRLEHAAELAGLRLDIQWRPYQLDPTLPDEGKDRARYLEEKFGSPERAESIYARIRDAGREDGIAFAFEKIERSPNTLDSHRLIRWARRDGAQDAVVERLFKAYFIDGADLTRHETLVDIAAECGLDRTMIADLLASEADIAETRGDIETAQRIGVTGVPCFILDGKYAVVGAEAAETLAGALRKAAEEAASAPDSQSIVEPAGDDA